MKDLNTDRGYPSRLIITQGYPKSTNSILSVSTNTSPIDQEFGYASTSSRDFRHAAVHRLSYDRKVSYAKE